ncbi:MAG TPA: uracil-DNA glycosylase family protein [Chitinophagaceae bacterium]|nr:uracil-DNA glycosylase family protein [Chitinophagaceae bacterium]
MPTLGDQLCRFYLRLNISASLPAGIEILQPYNDPEVRKLVKIFFKKFYDDNRPRRLLIGINPGRYGAGVTGINFTAPRQLRENCGIVHHFGDSSELSAEFIYEVIAAYGGPKKFFGDYFIGSVSPLGFVQEGKNLNYYDNKDLQKALTPFISDCLDQLLSFGFDRSRCACIGGEKNFRFLQGLNEVRKQQGKNSFSEIIPLPHPRFIMQYRRKQKQAFIELYLQALRQA